MPRTPVPIVALVGRTNVGKSTLFNRLLERSATLVSDEPGTTRDRKEGECIWRGNMIKIVDTGGLDKDMTDEIERNVVKQAEKAIVQADLILFVVDLDIGPLPQDRVLAAKLAKTKKPVLVVGNKAETPVLLSSVHNKEWRLAGLPVPLAVSAVRGTGTGDLLDAIFEELAKAGKPPKEMTAVNAVRVAVIGKPNVGKSSLLNAILGEERFIASPIAHTTREPNDVLVETPDGREYILIDTAGIRKSAKVRKTGGLEAAGVSRTKRVLDSTDVALFVVDVSEPIGAQDRILAGLLQSARVGVIVVANKWDLIKSKSPSTITEFRKAFVAEFPFFTWAPVTFVSALTGQRVPDLFAMVDKVQARRHTELPPEELEAFWRSAVKYHLPTKAKGPQPPKVLGMMQIATEPPTFQLTVKVKRTDALAPSWLRYLENRMRERFDLEGTPISIQVNKAQAGA